MTRSTGHWAFKTDLIDFRTGAKKGICKHYVWAQEANGERVLLVEKRIVEKVEANKKYLKVLNGVGFRIEPMGMKFDTLFAYAQIAVEAREMQGKPTSES